MQMTNEEMSQAVDALSQLNEQGRLGYAIARNLHLLKEECQEYMDLKSQLLRKYGEPNGSSQIIISGENLTKYREEMGDLPEETADVEVYRVSEDVFLSGCLTSRQMESLLWMVE